MENFEVSPDHKLVDPDLVSLLSHYPQMEVNAETLPKIRELSNDPAVRAMSNTLLGHPSADLDQIDRWETQVAGLHGAPDVRILCYRPKKATGPLPAILHVHGGGMITGMPEMMDARNASICANFKCMIVSVDYRLAPETTAPRNVEDCYAALRWLFGNAVDLGVDASNIGLVGESAGGGLAAALALMARDLGECNVAFQALLSPMLDDRTGRDGARPPFGEYIWRAESNVFGWSALIGSDRDDREVPLYASPARADDVAGLPPTFISIGALDLFFGEAVEFARRLGFASVPIELHVYPGAYHGFEMAVDAPIAARSQRDFREALGRFLGV